MYALCATAGDNSRGNKKSEFTAMMSADPSLKLYYNALQEADQ